jgi:cell fate regulator YaaT (PSP1 superfamily)
MEVREYLLSFGSAGEFGRFRPFRPVEGRRGDRAVVRTYRGLELGVFLCVAQPGHATFLPNTTVGQLVRLATPEDEAAEERMRLRAQEVFEAAQGLASELALPIEILDAEVLLDGEQAVLHHLGGGSFDERELVSRLASRFDLRVALHSLKTDPAPAEEPHEHGCGRPDCGSGEGGCSSCGSGGCGSCGAKPAAELQAYFAGLREQMEQRSQNRMPLL